MKTYLLLNYTLRYEDVLGVEVWLQAFLTSLLDGGEWSASRPSRFTPGVRALVTHGYKAGWAPESVLTRWREEIP
jgi:hypothetical protein